jgi:hypothetical protein
LRKKISCSGEVMIRGEGNGEERGESTSLSPT